MQPKTGHLVANLTPCMPARLTAAVLGYGQFMHSSLVMKCALVALLHGLRVVASSGSSLANSSILPR